jgi:plasmid stabilization system protein ParE
MKYEVTISERAEKNLDRIIKYLEENWSEKVKNNFIKKLNNEVNHLRVNPYINQASDLKNGVRRCFITKHNSMYYQIKENNVEIITIHDTRSDPKSLQL